MDEDEIDKREGIVANTMDDVWVLAELLTSNDGEWTDEAQDIFDGIRKALCIGLGVKEDDVIRRET